MAIAGIYDPDFDEGRDGRRDDRLGARRVSDGKLREQGAGGGGSFRAGRRGKICATARINQEQVLEYADGNWLYSDASDDEIMVLHTLVVDPQIAGHGYGKAFVSFYEQYAKEHNCPYLRMDTNEINAAARRFYAKLGFPGIGDRRLRVQRHSGCSAGVP